MKISATVTKNNLSWLRKLPFRNKNAVWRIAKNMERDLINSIRTIETKYPTRFKDSRYQQDIEDLMISRVRLTKQDINVWEVGVFAQTSKEYRIFLLHEFGGSIRVSEKMRKWWAVEFGWMLQRDTIEIKTQNVIRPILNKIPDFEVNDTREPSSYF